MTMNEIMACVLVLFIVWKIIKRIVRPKKRIETNIRRKPSIKMVYVVYLCSAILVVLSIVLLFLLPYRMI